MGSEVSNVRKYRALDGLTCTLPAFPCGTDYTFLTLKVRPTYYSSIKKAELSASAIFAEFSRYGPLTEARIIVWVRGSHGIIHYLPEADIGTPPL